MTKAEAIKALKEGKAVSHSSFTDDEWVKQKGIMIIDECGYRCYNLEWWLYRNNQAFLDGWSIVEPNNIALS